MIINNVICIISNYDRDFEARHIKSSLNCPTIIVDSSGKTKDGFHPTDEPFGAGCFNKACELFLQSDATHCLFVCSDVKGNIQGVIDRMRVLPEDIAIYSPAVLGQGWLHEKPQKYGLRDVPFCEGMIHGMTRAVINATYPLDAKQNPHGYGADIFKGYVANVLLRKRIVIDDDINVYHPFGTSYNADEGRRDMVTYLRSKGSEFISWYNTHIANLPNQ